MSKLEMSRDHIINDQQTVNMPKYTRYTDVKI